MSDLTCRPNPNPSIALICRTLSRARAERNAMIGRALRQFITGAKARIAGYVPDSTTRPLTPRSAG